MQSLPTLLVAIYGAVVSTAVGFFQIRKHFQDSAKLKVTASISFIVPGNDNREYLNISVVNIGRRPLTITNVGGHFIRYKEGLGAYILPQTYTPIPKKLDESEKIELVLEPLTPRLKETIQNSKFIGVYDSHGKCHKIVRKNLKYLKATVNKISFAQ